MTNKIKNTDYIKQNYKSSTIGRLIERYGYDCEGGLDIDPDITYALEVCKKHDPRLTQDFLFEVLDTIHEDFNAMMDAQYPNGFFNF
jgi:hypothetical protein